jgi:hypothetical protein
VGSGNSAAAAGVRRRLPVPPALAGRHSDAFDGMTGRFICPNRTAQRDQPV